MGPSQARVVARYADGRVVKGFSERFDPTVDVFLLTRRDAAPGDVPVAVRLAELKALFFVEDFDGEPDYSERKEFLQPATGRRLRVRFKDGEELVGTSLTYDPTRKGFFLFPGDPFSNNNKVFVIAAFVDAVTRADAATGMS